MRLLMLTSVLLVAGCAAPVKKFEQYECPHNSCATHAAGYEWAKKNKICDREWCNSSNPYFNQGCVAWTMEKPPLPDGSRAPLDFDPSRKPRPAPIPPGNCDPKVTPGCKLDTQH